MRMKLVEIGSECKEINGGKCEIRLRRVGDELHPVGVIRYAGNKKSTSWRRKSKINTPHRLRNKVNKNSMHFPTASYNSRVTFPPC